MAEKVEKKAPARKSVVSADKDYQIVVKKSEFVIAAEDAEVVSLAASAESGAQQWNLVPVGDSYKIVCKENGKVLDIILAGTENGAQIHLWEFTGADNQLWDLVSAGSGYYKIKSKASGKCLDVAGMVAVEGARVQIWDDVNGDNQKWKLKALKAPAAKKPAAKKAAAPKTATAKKAAAPKKAAAKPAEQTKSVKKEAGKKAEK